MQALVSMLNFMRKTLVTCLVLAAAAAAAQEPAAESNGPAAPVSNPVRADSRTSGDLQIVDDPRTGLLTVRDRETSVLSYRYKEQLAEGVDPRYARSCYIHPLYSLDGEVLTDDFPSDHLHHRGIFWTWPVIEARGRRTQSWEPVIPSLRQRFVRWGERAVDETSAVITAENAWLLDEQEEVARERVTVRVFPVSGDGRAVDVELVLEAVGGPLRLQGQPAEGKGYGGLCLRAAPRLKGAQITTDAGPREKDAVNERHRWADLSRQEGSGVAFFVAPEHPDFPPAFFIRNSYAGFLNVSWPGLQPVTLNPGEPVTLRYRIYIHRGDARTGQVQDAYREFTPAP